eukprot:COSAG02_NODE_468_length_21758_cov_41.206796_9_plen_71_part_00
MWSERAPDVWPQNNEYLPCYTKILSPSIIINYLVSQHILAVQFLDRSQCEEVATRLKGSGALTTSTVSSH